MHINSCRESTEGHEGRKITSVGRELAWIGCDLPLTQPARKMKDDEHNKVISSLYSYTVTLSQTLYDSNPQLSLCLPILKVLQLQGQTELAKSKGINETAYSEYLKVVPIEILILQKFYYFTYVESLSLSPGIWISTRLCRSCIPTSLFVLFAIAFLRSSDPNKLIFQHYWNVPEECMWAVQRAALARQGQNQRKRDARYF